MARGLTKTATYAVMHFVVAVAVAYALTGDVAIALSIGLIEPTVQTVAYAVHERVWDRVRWFASRRPHHGQQHPQLSNFIEQKVS